MRFELKLFKSKFVAVCIDIFENKCVLVTLEPARAPVKLKWLSGLDGMMGLLWGIIVGVFDGVNFHF